MKRYIVLFIVFVGFFGWLISVSLPADAKKASRSKGALTEKQVEEINTTVTNLTKKMYTRELFSPKDSEDMIFSKIQLDMQMDVAPEPNLAPIYFRLGNLMKLREMKPEAIECYQTVLENFSDTAYAPKARAELKNMGVEIKENLIPKDEEF